MDSAWIVELLFRWMHILAAITAVGGTIFMRLALVPAVRVLSDEEHAKLREALRSKWARWVHLSIAFLLLSGFYNYLVINAAKNDFPKFYHPVAGTKILLALAIFFIASMLMGRSEAAQRFRQKAPFWLSVNMTLAVIVVLMSGLLKTSHGRKPAEPAAALQPAENARVAATR